MKQNASPVTCGYCGAALPPGEGWQEPTTTGWRWRCVRLVTACWPRRAQADVAAGRRTTEGNGQ